MKLHAQFIINLLYIMYSLFACSVTLRLPYNIAQYLHIIWSDVFEHIAQYLHIIIV